MLPVGKVVWVPFRLRVARASERAGQTKLHGRAREVFLNAGCSDGKKSLEMRWFFCEGERDRLLLVLSACATVLKDISDPGAV